MLNVQLPVQTAVDDTETDESIASVPSQEGSITDVEGDSDLDELSVLYEQLMDDSLSADEVCEVDV